MQLTNSGKAMAEQLKLTVTDQPTYLNKEAAIGTVIFPVIGTIIGAVIGKRRMGKEQTEGRPVTDEPSPWNKDTLLGAALGRVLGVLIGLAAGVIVGGPVGFAISLGAQATGIVIGGMLGSKEGQRLIKQDFEQARHQQTESAISDVIGRTPARELATAKTRDFAPGIEQERGHDMHHGR